MPKQSAGILLYRIKDHQPQFFIVHPGGPFFKNKDAGVWSIPKGEFENGEDILAAAEREFTEETGQAINGEFTALEPVKLKSGKKIYAFAVEGEVDESKVISNTFPFEWPPRSGKTIMIPEVDKGDWFDADTAKLKLNPGQIALIDNLLQILSGRLS
ncbi:NUDIX domain-containing protein [Mucilaginibacter gynuensis]|uniref:NUDIX domain-containing protein n=1 Tax=Mucilaginibacter gynuensis TaxID=1302236 RepID=A0ABP8FN29_9SPHI